MKKIRILALTLLTATAVTTNLAHADTECASKKDIVAVASSAGSFNTLVAAVKAAGLVDALNNPSSKLTVFAPNDMAFIRTARDFGYTGWDEAGAFNAIAGVLGTLDPNGKGDPIPALTNVLLYHVTSGSLGPIQVLLSGSIHTLLRGASFDVRFLRLVDDAPKRPDPYLNPFALNIKASNGVIHGITRVLLPVDA
jgi:uncharacterized surface protein with fasciclin (FAS1) repeats